MVRKKLFLIIILFSITWFLSACKYANDALITPVKIGSSGPILIQKRHIPFIVDENIIVQVTPPVGFKWINTDKELVIFPDEPLEIGEEFDVKVNRDNMSYLHKTRVRQPCLVYLGNITTEPEIWKFCGQEHELLTHTEGRVLDYTASKSGNWILYSARNEEGGSDIWKINSEGEKQKKVYVCGDLICNNVAIDPLDSHIALFSSRDKGELILISVDDDEEIIIEKGNISEVDFSPNGQFLRYFSITEGNLKVLDIGNLNLIQTIDIDSDLIGSWSYNSSMFLYGKRDFTSGIGVIEIYETNVVTGATTKLFDGQELILNYFEPTYFKNGDLVVLVRTRFSGNSKQIWVINREGENMFEITKDHQYDHSGFDWNLGEEKISFQRYLLTSSNSLPDVWIWDSQKKQHQFIAENAARAIWIP